MRIATWNVNSVRQRIGHLLDYLREVKPDALCLQEIKCLDEQFPRMEIEDLGYNVETHGQKTFNGVAILAKRPFEVARGLPGDDADTQSRYIEAVIPTDNGVVRLASVYLPNGNPVESDKFPYKLAWMERLMARARALLAGELPAVLAGDYNVAPTDADVYDPEAWRGDALCRPESRRAFRTLLHAGFTDAFRVFHTEPHRYSFWDYQAMRWNRDEGLRIDHLLLSPQASDLLIDVGIDSYVRGWDKPSDHVPVWADLDLEAA